MGRGEESLCNVSDPGSELPHQSNVIGGKDIKKGEMVMIENKSKWTKSGTCAVGDGIR